MKPFSSEEWCRKVQATIEAFWKTGDAKTRSRLLEILVELQNKVTHG